MIKNIFLDLDDTVFDFLYAEAEALCRLLHLYGIESTEQIVQRYSEINDWHWKRLERGELTRSEVQVGRFVQLFEELGVKADPEMANLRYKELIAKIQRYIDGAEQLLSDLKANGYRIYIVSNGSKSVQEGRLAIAGLSDFFDGVFLSEELGVEKPDRRFFDICFAKVGESSKGETVILGDSLTSDVLGGINAGIKTCWFNQRKKQPRADIVPDFEISHLSQFLPLLKKL